MARGDGTGGAGKSEESEVQASGMTKTDGAAMKRLRRFLFLGKGSCGDEKLVFYEELHIFVTQRKENGYEDESGI